MRKSVPGNASAIKLVVCFLWRPEFQQKQDGNKKLILECSFGAQSCLNYKLIKGDDAHVMTAQLQKYICITKK